MLTKIVPVSPDELHLDRDNPRMPEQEFRTEREVLEFLVQNYDIEELILSILGAGWLDFEPFIVLRDENVVLEGNRRLAALRLIRSPEERALMGYSLPDNLPPSPGRSGVDPFDPDLKIPVRFVSDRRDAYVFLGFKHINGPYKWKSLAKAKFASDWLGDEQTDVQTISRMLGDSHNTVVRLINGWRMLNLAQDSGFDPRAISSFELPISHIYTALPRPSVRDFLGIEKKPTDVLRQEDIPKDRRDNLVQLMTWIYGQEPDRRALVRRQNPDLNKLVRVLASGAALSELIATGDLERAVTRLTPIADRFDTAVRSAAKSTEEALVLVDGFDGELILIEIVNGIGRNALQMRRRMEEITKAQEPEDPLAAFGDAPHKS